ncbi:Protein IWS1-like [Oopsacas minuta]|uniref:Protein IWS1-like n=1 Tax=Oopsacas minuta TaxID=111878 RepID=A0AAV7K0D2_9METZ|nr:Protein IWS1-like [Oopsacas minuta]
MKKAYVSNFNESDVELSGPGSGEESNGELDNLAKETAPPIRGYVSDAKSTDTSKKGLVISSDSDGEFDNTPTKDDKPQDIVNSNDKDINQSLSDLDFDSDIDIDEELERSLQSKKFLDQSSIEEKDHLKAVEDDIFGASDDEDVNLILSVRKRKSELDEGGSELHGPQDKKYRYEAEGGDLDGDEGEARERNLTEIDLILSQKKKKIKRRKRGIDSIPTNDEPIMDLLKSMQEAAQEDRELNEKQQTAFNKLKLLPTLKKQLQRQDSLRLFVECGLLSVLAEWLCPLPDKSLPHLQIRTEIIRILEILSVNLINTQVLKVSGIGKAVMLLYKHPKEGRKNRERAAKLIHLWARPIFGVESNLKSMSRDEREERDHKHAQNVRRRHSSARESVNSSSEDHQTLRPGEKGFVGRARVPQPSTRDYVTRPKWNVQTDITQTKRITPSKIDNMVRDMKSSKSKKVLSHAAILSIEGSKMPL